MEIPEKTTVLVKKAIGFFFNAIHSKLINFCECFQIVHENVISLVNVKLRIVPELQYGEAKGTFSLSFSV